MARGLMSLIGNRAAAVPAGARPMPSAPSAPVGAGRRSPGVMPGAAYFAKGGQARPPHLAKGGFADPEDHEPEVPPELKLAAYELLACLDSGSYGGGPDGKSSRAESFAKHMLAFFRLAEEMPHEEGPHVEDLHEAEEGGEEDEGY